MENSGLPGLQARYQFVPAGERVELRLDLRFDPPPAGLTQDQRNVWLELRDRLSGGTGNRLPPVEAKLVTSLAAAPLTVAADGTALRERLAGFVAEIAALPAGDATPVVAGLAFDLPKAGIADLPRDIFRLAIRLEAGPETMAIASARLDEGQGDVDLASAFEESWQGFDGRDGRLALAVEEPSDGAAYWCVRIAAAGGIGIGPLEEGEAACHAVPPLSTEPLSGTVEEDGRTERFESIDLDSWWDFFASSFARVEAVAGGGDIGDRFRRARGALARGLAGRLMPLAGAGSGGVPAPVSAVYEEAAAADLQWRPLVVSEAVRVSRGGATENSIAPGLRGRAPAPVGTGSAAVHLPGRVPLAAGRQTFVHAAPPDTGEGARAGRPARFEGERIDRQGLPPLRLLLRARTESDPLSLDLDGRPLPRPRIALPGPAALSCSIAAAPAEPETASAALAWSLNVESAETPDGRDRLDLALDFEPDGKPRPAPGRAPEGALFDALGRAGMSARSMPDPPDPASIERFAALAEAVAEALPDWPRSEPEVDPLPGRWRFAVDFHALPALIVSREAPGGGRLPPWPAVAGFVTPASDEGKARYEPEPGAGARDGLALTFTGLRLLADRSVRVHGRIGRNANVVDSVGPAFVYPGPIESSPRLEPWLEWRAPRPEPEAARLEAALDALLRAIDETSAAPYGLGVEAALLERLESADEAAIQTRIPLFLVPPKDMGDRQSPTAAELARALARALSAARAGLQLDRRDREIALTITLFDREPARSPLARLDVRIAIPADEAWWGPAGS